MSLTKHARCSTILVTPPPSTPKTLHSLSFEASKASFTLSMASHHHPHHCSHRPPPLSTHCCCNPSYPCCSCAQPHHPPQSTHHLAQAIASFLSQSHPSPTPLHTHYPKFQAKNILNLNQYQTHSSIASLLSRIEALESSLHHFSSHSYHSSFSLRDTAARVIQTHFRAFLVRRSRTLSQLKNLASIKSSFNSLESTFSNETHIDCAALSREAMVLLLKLDSIQGDDPMIRDGKRSISKGLVQFLDSIEGFAVKKHWRYVKVTKNNAGFGQKVNKSRVWDSKCRNSGGDQSKMLQSLRERVEKISRLFKVSSADDDDQEAELGGINNVVDEDGDSSVVISGRNGVAPTKNGVFVQRLGVRPRVKKSVSFAENGNISKVSSRSAYEPALSGDLSWTFLDGSSSIDDQGELLENVTEDVIDSSQGAEDDEEAMMENGGSPHSSDGERNSRSVLQSDGRNEGKVQLQEPKEKLLFSAPLPLKMEDRADLMKSKGVRIVT